MSKNRNSRVKRHPNGTGSTLNAIPRAHTIKTKERRRTAQTRADRRPRTDKVPVASANKVRRQETETTYAFERLSAQDQMFLQLESPNVHMHIAATLVFGPSPLTARNGQVDLQELARHIESRLPSIPRYRQRVVNTPLRRDAVWIDDDQFNLGFHLRPSSLARHGDIDQLKRLSGRTMSQKLDRGKPLWEMHVVNGLPDGRFALVNKTHHCMADGVAGAELLAALLSTDPRPSTARTQPVTTTHAPATLDLLREDLRYTLNGPIDTARWLGALALQPRRMSEVWNEYAAPVWEALGSMLPQAPATPLNTAVGPHRRFDWTAFDLQDIKTIRNRLGGTVNDVVLATVAGALRRFLKKRDPGVELVDMRALVPVNVRGPSTPTPDGNHVSAWLIPLPVQEWDPRKRLARIAELSADMKRTNSARGGEVLSNAASPFLTAGLGLANYVRPFNIVVTNIPGPQFPLFLLGAPLEAVYPLVPLFPNQALGIALFSYNGKLFWGFNADVHVVPDLDDFAAAIRHSFADLLAAATPIAVTRSKKDTVPKRRSQGRAARA